MRVAQKFAGYSLAEADNLRKACGKKIRELMAERAREVRRRVRHHRLRRRTRQRVVRRHRAVRRLRVQQEPQLRLRLHRLPDRRISRRTSRSSTSRRCSRASRRRSTKRRCISTSAASWASMSRCPTSTYRVVRLSRRCPMRSQRRSARVRARSCSGSQRCATSARVSSSTSRRTQANGPFATSTTSASASTCRCSTSAPSSRLIKAGASIRSAIARKGLLSVFERIIDQTVARRREHDMGVMSLFGERRGRRRSTSARRSPTVEFDKTPSLAFEKEMLGLYISDHPLMGAEAALRRKTDCTLPSSPMPTTAP